MNHERHNLLSIGGFADATQLSPKALRLYDQLGLITPRYVDPGSGCRYYHSDQLHAARTVRMLRQMEMPLATIRQVLAAPAHAETLVHDHVRRLETQARRARGAMQHLLHYLEQEKEMTLEIQVHNVETQQVVSITKHVNVAQLNQTIQESIETIIALVKAQGGATTTAPFGIYHGPINEEEHGPIEVCLPVKQNVAVEGEVQARELPAGQVASVMMRGEQCAYPAILQGYDALSDWVRQHGYEIAASPREIWHAAGQIEIAWPFREQKQ